MLRSGRPAATSSGILTPLIAFGILGYVRISLGYPWDIYFSKDITGMSLAYPVFLIFKSRYP
jgi:hypothetical protein